MNISDDGKNDGMLDEDDGTRSTTSGTDVDEEENAPALAQNDENDDDQYRLSSDASAKDDDGDMKMAQEEALGTEQVQNHIDAPQSLWGKSAEAPPDGESTGHRSSLCFGREVVVTLHYAIKSPSAKARSNHWRISKKGEDSCSLHIPRQADVFP